MDSSDGSAPKKFSSEDRIRQLNEIDKDITELVNSAGSAIQALTNNKLAENVTTGNSLNERKAAFKASTSQYFQLLSSIDVRLRRQVYALEEAGILESEVSTTTAAASFKGDSGIGLSTTGSGTFNPLEISWLNSRKDTVGKNKEAESWAAARDFLGSARGNAPDTEPMDTHT